MGGSTQSSPLRRGVRGQAMSEFIIAMAVLLPLFLAISYVARYGDLQQRATQASRYAAFQRAMQPQSAVLPDAKIEDQMRARFFLAPMHLHGGKLQSDDSAAAIKNADGQPALWADLGGKALLASPAQVKLGWNDMTLGSGAVANSLGWMTKTAGKTYPGGRQAQVEVTLLDKMDLSDNPATHLVLGAATAAAGNGLGSSGSIDTRNAAATLVPSAKIPGFLKGFLGEALGLFEPTGPEIGCIKPDVVPTHRLEGAPNNGKCL